MMTLPEILQLDGVEQITLSPKHRLSERAAEKGCLGILWTSKCGLLGDLDKLGSQVVPNTTRADLMKGDYGAVFVEGGYLIVCDASTADRMLEAAANPCSCVIAPRTGG